MTNKNNSADRVLARLQSFPQGAYPADLSRSLGLGPSTVRKHLTDLVKSGRAQSVSIPYAHGVRRLKYFPLNGSAKCPTCGGPYPRH